MSHPAFDSLFWRSVVKADRISERTGVPTADLYLMNQEVYPDPLDQLLYEESLMTNAIHVRFTDNVKTIADTHDIHFEADALKLLKANVKLDEFDITQLVGTGPNGAITSPDVMQHLRLSTRGGNENPDPSIPSPQGLEWHPDFVNSVDSMLQDNAQRMYTAGFWVASLLFSSPGEFDFTPSPDQVKKATGMALSVGVDDDSHVCPYAYNGDEFPGAQRPEKRMSRSQYTFFKSVCNTVQQLLPFVKACKKAGFQVHYSVEDMHNAVLVQIATKKERKDRDIREHMERMNAANQTLAAEADDVYA